MYNFTQEFQKLYEFTFKLDDFLKILGDRKLPINELIETEIIFNEKKVEYKKLYLMLEKQIEGNSNTKTSVYGYKYLECGEYKYVLTTASIGECGINDIINLNHCAKSCLKSYF